MKMNFSYDEQADILTFNGVRFSGEFLRMFTEVPGEGRLFKIINSEGIVTVQTVEQQANTGR
jgi:hypothetical protein